MDDSNKTKDQLIEELEQLRTKFVALERSQLTHEQKIKLAIFDRVPFSIWACDRDFKIVLWNLGAEENYGCRSHDALGSDYSELFVDVVEQEQSRKDCRRTIDDNISFTNFIAYDHTRDGTRR